MDIRFYILDALNASGNHCAYIDLLNTMQRDHNIPGTVTRALLKEMTKERLVSGAFKAYGGVRLESAGLALCSQMAEDALAAEAKAAQEEAKDAARDAKRLKERSEDNARQEKYHREQKRLSIASIVVLLFTFVAGVLIERAANIVDWILSFF